MTTISWLQAHLTGKSRDERGALLAEYGILIAFIAGVVAAAVWALGGAVVGLYDLPAPF